MRKVVGVLSGILAILALPACSSGLFGSNNIGFGYNAAPVETKTPKIAKTQSQSLTKKASLKVKKPATKANGPALNAAEARDMVNIYRETHGLKPVLLHPKLSKAAELHAKDLAKQDTISHFGSDGSDPWQRVIKAGYKPILAAENVGTGQRSFEEVMLSWQQSPEHKKNLLLKEATHLGVAMIHEPGSEYKTFWALIVGQPLK